MWCLNTYRNPSDVNQQWGFSPTGQIYTLSNPDHVLTYIEGHTVKNKIPQENPLDGQEAVTTGLENLHFLNDLELYEETTVSPEPNIALSDKKEEAPETAVPENGLVLLKDEFLGCRYSIVLLPKRHADETQR